MYAVFENGGKQYKVYENQIISLEKINSLPKTKLIFTKILMIVDNENIFLENKILSKATIDYEIIDHLKGKKIKIIKFNRRKHYHKQLGHSQHLTKIKINKINFKEK